jgi:hypothetical protein
MLGLLAFVAAKCVERYIGLDDAGREDVNEGLKELKDMVVGSDESKKPDPEPWPFPRSK